MSHQVNVPIWGFVSHHFYGYYIPNIWGDVKKMVKIQMGMSITRKSEVYDGIRIHNLLIFNYICFQLAAE